MTKIAQTLLAGCAAFVLMACEKPADRVEITETAPRSDTRPVPQINVSSADRFELASPQVSEPVTPNSGPASEAAAPMQAAQAGGASASAGMFTYDVPSGWTQAPSSQFRDPNFTYGPNNELECYVSVLQGPGGGMLVNANRWRGQLGQPPYTEDEFAHLPRASILGREAVIVEFTGDFLPMGAADRKPGYRLVGALLEAPMAAVFIKMTGPDQMVQDQKDNFAIFAQSLKMNAPAAPSDPAATAAAPAADAAAAPTVPPATTAEASGLQWKAPEGWTQSAGSSMRVVTYKFGAQSEGECYVASLPGTAGGRLENFNRWLAQMGQHPLEETELELQPPVFMFGEEVPMLIAQGTFTGMGGDTPKPGYILLGALAEVDGQSVFVKLVAPEALAQENMQKFAAFCASLKKK